MKGEQHSHQKVAHTKKEKKENVKNEISIFLEKIKVVHENNRSQSEQFGNLKVENYLKMKIKERINEQGNTSRKFTIEESI